AASQPAFPRNCAICHTALGWTPAFLPSQFTAGAATSAPRDHERLFPIQTGRHRGATCESCHERGALGGAVDCRGCHDHSTIRLMSQHRGQPTPFDAVACLHCHPGGAAR
ncbi:MAG TPA: hypothetical protein VMV18_11100, partial [bacterium]|nr:hypothetical protein [bacterium]